MTVLPEWILVAKQRVEKRAKELPIPGLGDGNELIRSDVPRLVELVGEMAEVLESFRDTDCQRMGCMQCRDDVCLSKLWGRLDDVLAKYHGEAESND